jgi:hypothetical protein
MTSMLPLPDEASDDSPDMALNVLFRSPMEIDAAAALLEVEAGADVAEEELELELLLELQAAMSSAALRPAATTPAFLMEDTNIPRLLAVACPAYRACRESESVHAGHL